VKAASSRDIGQDHATIARLHLSRFPTVDMIRLTPPSTPAFLISLLLGGAGIAGKLGYFAIAAPNAFWLLTTAFVLLLLSTIFKGL
jgi:hypothetical protein